MTSADALFVTALLEAGRVCVGLPGRAKAEVIEGVLGLLDGAPEVVDPARARADVFGREAVMSTGVGKGLALPHARTRAVTGPVAALAVTAGPVYWDALDGHPVRLVLLLLVPEEERGLHVRLLSRISRLMSDEAFRDRLVAAPSGEAVLAAFRDAEERLG